MIAYLNGTVAHKDVASVIMEVNGVGYQLSMSAFDIGQLPPVGDSAKVFTYLYVREDNLDLFGFESREALAYFHKLISVNGVGPKAALSILNTLRPGDLAMAILAGDTKAISRAHGVGAKVAQRIVLELKGKVDGEDAIQSPAGALHGAVSADASAVNALIALGSSPSEAQKCVMQIDASNMTTEDIIKEALRRMSRGI